MQGQTDISQFIQSFTGSHHFVLDYLIEEVVTRQVAHIQDFLLKTSILDRFCQPLCDAGLQGYDDAQATLEYIRQANLFLIPPYSQKLLRAFENTSSPEPSRTSQPLIDPLSERELEVLRLIAEGLTNRVNGYFWRWIPSRGIIAAYLPS